MKNPNQLKLKKTLLYAFFGGMTLVGINSCENLENLCGIEESNLATGEVFVTSLNHMVDVYSRVDNVSKDSLVNATGSNIIDGATCTKSNDSLIIDFGNTPVLCQDGKYRSGTIRSKVRGTYEIVGSEITSVLSNYLVNENHITGDFNLINNGPNNNPVFSVSTTSFAIDTVSEISYNFEMTWESGFVSPELDDDIFDVSGSVTGNDYSNSVEFSSTILDPLHYVYACPNLLEKGEIELILIDNELVPTFNIDFIENDGCNNLFKSTVDCDGQPISFTYPFN